MYVTHREYLCTLKSVEWLNYHHLLYFWTVVRAGSITAASRELRLAGPTISVQLRQLEESLGEKLLIRSGRSVIPTEAGRLAFRYAEEIFSTGRELRDALKGRPAGRPLRVVIGIADVLPKLIAHQIIEPALRLAQPVRVVCHEDNPEHLLAELAIQELDLVLLDAPIGPAVKVRAYNHLLGESGVSFLARPRLAERYRGNFPHSLSGAPLLLPMSNSAIRRNLDQWFDRLGIRPEVVGEFEDDGLLREFGAQGVGVFPAASVVEKQLRRHYRVERVGRTQEVRSAFYAISTERKLKHPAVIAICTAARRELFARTKKQ
jgi:LysR family transcriptional regulator, transcriptional activator of nhaA